MIIQLSKMKQINSKERIISFDVLRIIAAFAVVMLHISGDRFISSFPTDEWEIRNVYDSLVRWSVPVFFMISGALFLNQEKRIGIKRLFSKNITRIICVFIFWSFLYALYDVYVDENMSIFFLFGLTIKGPLHLWFLKMLLGLYITIPILRMITQSKRIEEYFIVLAVLSTFAIPFFITLIGMFNGVFKEYAVEYYNDFGIRIASGYVGYFVLGHYLNSYQLSKVLKKSIYMLGILSIFSVILLTHWYSFRIEESSEVFYNNLNLFTLFESMAVFLAVREMKISKSMYPFIIKMSNLSLGVYLIHVFVFRIFHDVFGINSISLNPSFFIPCFSLIVFVISCIIVAILRKIPLMKRFVI